MIESRHSKTDISVLIARGMVAMRQFWTWWISELQNMLPATWRNALNSGDNRLLVAFENEQFVLGILDRDQVSELVKVRAANKAAPNFVRNYCRQNQLNADSAVLGLSRDQSMIKNLSLPGAVEENLEGMLRMEMDRHTPFRAEDVFFSQQVISRDRASKKIAVELVVVPKQSAAQFMVRLARIGVKATSMVVRLRDGALVDGEFVACANLLTANKEPQNRSAVRRRQRRLELAVMALAVMALLIPTIHYGLVERSLQQDVDAVQISAAKAQDARRQLLELVQPGEEFLRLRSSTPLAVAVLHEVTRVVPDDTWLDRMEIDQGRIRLQGESNQAAILLALFEESDLFSDARFSSTITRNARSERDRFTLEATVNRPKAP